MQEEGQEKLTLTVPEAASILRISRGAAYEAVRRGELPVVRFGRTIRVPTHALNRLLSGQDRDSDREEDGA